MSEDEKSTEYDHEELLDVDAGEDENPAGEDIEADEVPSFLRRARILSIVLAPIGALMAHLWLAWEGKEADRDHRKHALSSIFIGWPITLVVGLGLIFYFAETSEQRALDNQREEAVEEVEDQREQIIAQAAESDSVGEVDAAFCDAMRDDLRDQMPATGMLIVDIDEVDEDFVDGLRSVSETGQSPNAELYEEYADLLEGFEDQQAFEDHLDALTQQYDDEQEFMESSIEAQVATQYEHDFFACIDLDTEAYLDFEPEEIVDRQLEEVDQDQSW